MRNYYLMRSSAELIKENRIGYGWRNVNFSQYSSAESILEKINAGRRKSQVKRFFNLKEGDVVLVPTHCSVAIGVVGGEKFYDKNASKNAWNQVSVNFKKENGTLRKVSTRTNIITNHLLSRLRLRMTIANLNAFSKEIDSLIQLAESGRDDAVDVFYEKEAIQSAEIKKRLLANLRSGKNLRIKGGGDGFEELICELLRIDDFAPKIQSKKSNKGKGDIDIIAEKSILLGINQKLYIQAKHHRGKTGEKSVNQVDEAIGNNEVEQTATTMVISTGSFSDSVIDKAVKSGVILVNGEEFVDWLFAKIEKLSPATLYGLGMTNIPCFLEY